ncbi:MAG: Gfo/Idh/MocA family protein [bacterium]
MADVGVGVIGVGFFGSLHARIYSKLPGARLLALSDIDEERGGKVASELGVDFYADYREMLDRRDISAVSVCTSNAAHRAPTCAAAEAGKDILVEKPLATTLEDADAMIDTAKRCGVKLAVGHILRFDPRYIQAREVISSGGIGEPIQIWARRNILKSSGERYRGEVPPHFHLGVHDIDLMLWFLGRPVERVYSEGTNVEGSDGLDAVWTFLRFAGGCVGVLENCWVLPDNFPARIDPRMEVVGTSGTITIEAGNQGLAVCDGSGMHYRDTMHWPEVSGEVRGDLREELAHFIRSVAEDIPPAVSGTEGRATVEIALAISESLRLERPVNLKRT